MDSPSHYRYNTAREYTADLKTRLEQYDKKIKKYHRRITAIDVAVYSMSGIMAGAGVLLSSVTMIAPVAVPIAISAVTTIAGVATAITKKLSSCSQKKLSEYTIKHHIVSDAYSKLSELISDSINDSDISGVEFFAMTRLYNSAMSKLEIEDSEYNSNNVAKRAGFSTASTDRGEHHTGEHKHDIDNINEARIQCKLPLISASKGNSAGKITSIS